MKGTQPIQHITLSFSNYCTGNLFWFFLVTGIYLCLKKCKSIKLFLTFFLLVPDGAAMQSMLRAEHQK